MMKRWTMAAVMLLLAACGGGSDEDVGAEASADAEMSQATDAEAPVDMPSLTSPVPAGQAADEADADAGTGDAIPTAIRGRWALKVADCTARKGTDLTAVVIDATNLRFYESHGELVGVRERGPSHLVADYRFSGEGQRWDQRVELEVRDGGRTLVRRDHGEGAAAEALRYSRCAA